MKFRHKHKNTVAIKKVLVGVGVPLLLLTGTFVLAIFKIPLSCPLYMLLHIYCPGCGSGRSSYSLVHLRPVEAFRYNPLFVIALPFLGYYVLVQYLRYVFGFTKLPMFHPGKKTMLAILVAVIAFFVLRNIPHIVLYHSWGHCPCFHDER